MGLKNVFGWNLWPIGQIFGQISTSEISKFEEILGKNPKIRFFFFFKCGWESVKMPEYQKNIFNRSISPFKELKWILGPKMILNGPKWILKRVHIFQMWEKIQKKFHIFGKDFSVKKWERKIQKKMFFNFCRKKKYFFDVFLILFVFMENRQIGSKTNQNWQKHVFPSY